MIANTKKAKEKPLTNNGKYSYNRCNKCHLCNVEFDKGTNNSNLFEVKDFCYYTGDYRGAAHNKCSKKCDEEREIPIVFHNGSNYDYHFIINELAKSVDGLNCIGENSEKYITFKALLNKQCSSDKKVTYKLKFIDSFRFTFDSLENLVDNLTELNKCKECKKECTNYKRQSRVLVYRCDKCKKRSYKPIDDLIEKCSNVYSMCNGDLDKFLLLLRKGVYPYEYIDSWSRYNETQNAPFEKYYSKLDLKNITKEDYIHSQKVWNTFKIKDIGEYNDLYVRSDALQLADVFENFRNMCLKIYELDPSKFVSEPNLAWKACLKKTNIKLELITDMNMFLMLEKGIRSGIYQVVTLLAKANNKYLKCYDESIPSSFLKYHDANNLYGGAMRRKLPFRGFEFVDHTQ